MIVNYEYENITPAKAQEFLEKNYEGNRNIRKHWVVTLADMMTAGEFRSLNGQNTIIIGTDGKLYDGQHRMKAIIKSGVTLPFLVVTTNTPLEDYATYDYASARQAKDIVNVPCATAACAIARQMIAVERYDAPIATWIYGHKSTTKGNYAVSRTEVTNFINENTERVNSITRRADRVRKNLHIGSTALIGAFIELVEYVHDDILLDDFLDDLCSLDTVNRAVILYKETLRRAYMSAKKPTKTYVIGMMLCAYTHYKNMDNVSVLNKPSAYVERYDKMLFKEREARRNQVKHG